MDFIDILLVICFIAVMAGFFMGVLTKKNVLADMLINFSAGIIIAVAFWSTNLIMCVLAIVATIVFGIFFRKNKKAMILLCVPTALLIAGAFVMHVIYPWIVAMLPSA